MVNYGRGAAAVQLTSEINRVDSSNELPFKDALSSEQFAKEFASASIDYRERIFSPSDDTTCFHGAGT